MSNEDITTSDIEEDEDKPSKFAVFLYPLLIVAIGVCFIPDPMLALIGLGIFTAYLLLLYIIKGSVNKDGALHTHATYLIGTIWAVSSLSVLTVTVASIYLMDKLDDTPFEPCEDKISDMVLSDLQFDMNLILQHTKPCVEPYLEANFDLLMIGTAIGAGPLVLYLLYRILKGLPSALIGDPVKKPKSWF